MDDKDIIAAIENQEDLAESGSVTNEREEALDHYLGNPYGNEQDGRSQVVMRDVMDTIEWIKPALMKIFASADEVCSFNPVGEEDVKQAEQETDYINHLLMVKNQGFLILHDWFHDALLQKNGYVWAKPVKESKNQVGQYQNLTDDEFAMLMQNPSVECKTHSEYLDEMGQLRHNCAIITKNEYTCIKVSNVPPERVRIASDWPGVNLDGCPFVEIVEFPTISSLREMGLDVPDDISDSGRGTEEFEQRHTQNNSWVRDDLEADPATRRVKTRFVWMCYDEDGDGIAELNYYVVVGTTILDRHPDDLIPVACITPQRLPHEHTGLSIDDAVEDLQAIRTTLVRGFLDNMYLANNGRNAIDASRVNLDDMLTSRPGGVIRVTGDPNSAIAPIIHPQVGQSVLQAVEYIDNVRENRTGVTRYNQGIDSNSLNKTATGINAIQNASMQRIELIARLFAETGVKALMLILHALASKHSSQKEMVRLRGEWVPIDPSAWKTRSDLTISVGIGTGNKDQLLAHLSNIWQMQMQGLPLGISNPTNLHHTATKLTQNAGFKMSEAFWTDPQGKPAQPPPNPLLQVKEMELKAEAQKFQAETQQDQQQEQQNKQFEMAKLQMESDQKEKDRQMELAKTQMQEATKLEIAKINAEYGAQVEMVREQNRAKPVSQEWDDTGLKETLSQGNEGVAQMLQSLQATMQALAEAASRPRQILRGPDQRIIGLQ